MLDKSIRNIFRLRKIDAQELVLHDEIEPTSKDNPICVLSKHPNAADSNIAPGLSNPAFVPDVADKPKVKNVGSHSRSPEYDCQKEAWAITNGQEVPICSEMKGQSPDYLDVQPSPLANEQETWVGQEKGAYITQKLRELRKSFASRAQSIKEKIVVQAPTPSPSLSSVSEERESRPRLQSLIQPYDDQRAADDLWMDEMVTICCCRAKRRYIPSFPKVLDPQSKLYISWLLIVTLCYLYNAWAIFVRAAFPYQNKDNLYVFFSFDYFSDVTYFIDIFVFKVRIQYLHDGFWVDDPVMTRKNYLKKSMFTMDLLSLLPLDLLYLKYGPKSLFRLPRMLKVQTFWEFFNRVDAVAKSPYVIRILRTFIYMMYLIHLNACAYYAMSSWEGIGSNRWVFDGVGNAYIRCVYFATKTATSIGKNPKPENEYEYAFMTVSWLMGVFIFAFLIGQIRDIVATATQSKTQYRQRMDQTVQYMRNLGLPDDLQRRVRLWLNHTWEQQKTLDESMILDSLPRKMKTDVAINVHYNTLVKVQLFKDCDKALLRDLVLKLKPVLFLPGDYICMKGEVGKEMYIVNKGLVQVMGGEDGNLVLATLSEGSVFGEISLLGIKGSNRRTADVRSKGFSNLFVLSKADLWDALKNYPEAQTLLKKKAKNLIKKNEAFQKQRNSQITAEPIIKDLPEKADTPQFVRTVMQVLPNDSAFGQTLNRKSSNTKNNKGAPATNKNNATKAILQPSQKQNKVQRVNEKPTTAVNKPNSAPPTKQLNTKMAESPTVLPKIKASNRETDAPNQSSTVPVKKQKAISPTKSNAASANKAQKSTPRKLTPQSPKNYTKEMNGKSSDVIANSKRDHVIFQHVSEELPNKEVNEQKFPPIIQCKETPNEEAAAKPIIPVQQSNSISNNNTKTENLITPEQLTTTKHNKVSDNVQMKADEPTGSMQNPDISSEKANLQQHSTAKTYTTTTSTESSPSTETETTASDESKKVSQDASEFLHSILQLIPSNRQSVRLNKRPAHCASNKNTQPAEETYDKEDSNSTTSVLSLSSLFRTSSGESESATSPKELSLHPSTSTSSLIGYDNLAFITQDINVSRRSSAFSDETSC